MLGQAGYWVRSPKTRLQTRLRRLKYLRRHFGGVELENTLIRGDWLVMKMIKSATCRRIQARAVVDALDALRRWCLADQPRVDLERERASGSTPRDVSPLPLGGEGLF